MKRYVRHFENLHGRLKTRLRVACVKIPLILEVSVHSVIMPHWFNMKRWYIRRNCLVNRFDPQFPNNYIYAEIIMIRRGLTYVKEMGSLWVV